MIQVFLLCNVKTFFGFRPLSDRRQPKEIVESALNKNGMKLNCKVQGSITDTAVFRFDPV